MAARARSGGDAVIAMPGLNPFERSARFNKVRALVARLDSLCDGTTLHPVRDGAELADCVEAMPDMAKRALALCAGVIGKGGKMPSETTWSVVVWFLRERARRAN